jgi:UDP:flavonoid glycosyltransferase YjiC (YdhE family)
MSHYNMNQIMKIIIFSPPFSGHLNVLKYLKNSLEKLGHDVKLIVTGWTDVNANITSSETNIIELSGTSLSGSDNTTTEVNSSCPMTFTLNRVYNLTEKCLQICQDFNPKLIIYDFFSLEGYICGKNLSIPSFCSIPAMIGPYQRNNDFFKSKLQNPDNQNLFAKINQKYGINLQLENIQQVSDGILIPSDLNILWSYPKVIGCDEYTKYRNLKDTNFLILGPRKETKVEPSKELQNIIHKYQKKKALSPLVLDSIAKHGINISYNKQETPNIESSFISTKPKIIYISLGTVVTQNLWNHNPTVRPFVMELFNQFIQLFNDKEKYDIIVATGNNADLSQLAWPSNFTVCQTVNQLKVLSKAHLFITHCGGNSFNEALAYEVPMIGIPFFGDQHFIGHKINKLCLGVAFLHDDNNKYIGTENNPFYRSSLTLETLTSAITNIELNNQDFVDRIKKIKESHVPHVDSIIMAYHNYPLTWKNGDLLYGTNQDRLSLIKYLKIENDFRICKYLPFSKLFYDKWDALLLPRIVDIYNDGFLDANCYPVESSSRFTQYSANLKEYRTWLLDHKEFIAPVTNFQDITENNRDEVIWNICLGGIEFFTQVKGYHIHFVLEKYSKVNKATTLELQYIIKHWDRLKSKISFYHLDTKYGVFAKIPISHQYMQKYLI